MALIQEEVLETAVVTDSHILEVGAVLRDAGALSDAVTLTRVARLDMSDSFDGTSEVTSQRTVNAVVNETAVIVSNLTVNAALDIVYDAAVVVSRAVTRRTARVDVHETAQLESTADTSGFQQVTDRFVGSSYVYANARLYEDVLETAVIASSLADTTSDRRADITDTFAGLSSVSTAATLRESVHEVGYLTDWLYSTSGNVGSGWSVNDAWTCNVATWAMSRYTNVGVSNHNARFAVSNNGLYEPDSVAVEARVETGFLDFDTPVRKRAYSLYLQGTYDGVLEVDVTAEVDGVRATYTYESVADYTDTPTGVRVDVGRKFKSAYFKFAINSTARAELFGGKALVQATQRSI